MEKPKNTAVKMKFTYMITPYAATPSAPASIMSW